jgi:hypothetical protein
LESKSIPDRSWVRVAVVAAVAVAAGVVIWLVVRGNSSTSSPAAETVRPPRQVSIAGSTRVSERGLRRLAAVLGTPVYWAGRERGVTYELTEAPDGRTYLRYLPKGVAAGTRKPYLTVGTYPVADALAVTRAAARKQGVVRLAPGAGGVAFYAKSRPTNVYVAFPGSDYQIEVYGPVAAPMHELVAAGRIRPVHSSGARAVATGTTAAASSPAALAKLSATLAQPIYWLGRIPGSTYELTRTPDGRVYVRYLPAGVAVGSSKPYLTVASYPLADAVAATRAEAKKAGAVEVSAPHGAVAFFSSERPTNVYVAFPGVDEQIEIFAPSARQARRMVAAGRVRAVS